MIKYAEVWPLDGVETIHGYRYVEQPIPVESIKHVDGKPVLRPVKVEGYDKPGFDAELEDRLSADPVIQDDTVVEGYSYRWRPGVKATLKARVDAEAERRRMAVLTPGEGQALVYQRKAQEADACLAALASGQAAAPLQYPLLSAEVGLTAPTLGEVAAVVRAMADQWVHLAAETEAWRLAAKSAIDAAPDEAAAVAAWGGGV